LNNSIRNTLILRLV